MQAPKIETTSKEFKILSVTLDMCLYWGGIGICDSCSSWFKTGKYIAVLNSCYCQKCFDDWHKVAKNYPEDKTYEVRKIEDMVYRLNN